ncbi:unnamed protein product [Gongylonema pulchrum]|uniref:DUF7636 domain-containing protein n=2 Tax=Gongylonema pulchrum TaxID=637853 RepID=A0A3P6SNY6_9BILA|nr:unnamed protein product [Gongylonema pulchrum]
MYATISAIPGRVIVSAVGTFSALNKLRDLLSVRSTVCSSSDDRGENAVDCRLTVERLKKLD